MMFARVLLVLLALFALAMLLGIVAPPQGWH